MAVRDALFTLEKHKVFDAFKDSLSVETKTQNIIDCRDDILFLWHSPETCLLTLNIKTLESDENVNYQKLVGTESTTFDVTSISVNPISTWVAISGPQGICVLRLPRQSGCQALFQGGRETIICRSRILDERMYMSDCEIYRAKWHPNSSTDSHLLILASDNTLKLYDVSNEDQPLKHVWRVGPKCGRMPLLAALGDIAVDIATIQDDRATLLTGNGNIYLINIGQDNNKAAMQGPLPMYPPADDNYGLESCSVLMLNEDFLCIATCGGTLYHCIILPDQEVPDFITKSKISKQNQYSSQSPSSYYRNQTSLGGFGMSSSYNNSQQMLGYSNNSMKFQNNDTNINKDKQTTYSLYVIEAIELDLGLTLDEDDPSYTCPIYLTADEGIKNRYFCYHETGVHVITVPIVDHLQRFFNQNDEDINKGLPTFNTSSTVEYVICTKTSKMDVVNPPLGICLTYSTHALISILADGRLVIKPLDSESPADMLFNDSLVQIKPETTQLNKSRLTAPLNEMQKVPFHEQIRQILKHEMSQPLLKMASNSEPNAQECLELLSHATHIFREDYFTKIDRARKELEKRVKTLGTLKILQLKEIDEWERNRKIIEYDSKNLREKCDTAQNIQKDLNERCKKVLRALRQKQSVPSASEKEMNDQLHEYNKKIPELKDKFSKIKQKLEIQKGQLRDWDTLKKKEEIFLGKHLTEIIKNTLCQQNDQIKDLVHKMNNMKLEVGLN